MRKLFGTDGVRGLANKSPMTPDIMMRLAVAAGQYFKKDGPHAKVVIGKDTRLSGYMIESAMTAGFTAVGMDVILVGPIPTPAISMLVKSLRADLGVMISASHNPYQDNGVKLFDGDGFKLSDAVEKAIEGKVFHNDLEGLVESSNLGRAKRLEDASGRYIEFTKNTFPKDQRLEGLRIVVDCAHGAAYKVAPTVLWELGAEVIAIADAPNGYNINHHSGATSPEALQKAVLDYRADLGIALDGDADRLLLVDECGMIIDGDQVLALIAAHWHETGRLSSPQIVGTIMANLGLEQFLRSLGLDLLRTPVGDRHVSAAMRAFGSNIGGEQSGHVILSDYARTGDGLVAALQVLSVLVTKNKPLSQIGRLFTPFPQILRNIPLMAGFKPLDNDTITGAIAAAEAALMGRGGRLIVRTSGTEPLLRLMAEGIDESDLMHVLDDLTDVIALECLSKPTKG